MNLISFQSRSHVRTILVLLIAMLTMMPVVAAASCVPSDAAVATAPLHTQSNDFHINGVGQIDPCHLPPTPDQHLLTITFAMPLAVGMEFQQEPLTDGRIAAHPPTVTGLSPPEPGEAPEAPPPNTSYLLIEM